MIARVVSLILLALLCLGCVPTDDAPEPAATPDDAEATGQPLGYANWETSRPGEHPSYNQRANLIQRGRRVYDKYCVGCHGERGQGDGPAAVRLITQPRDFTSGVYKFRSTDSGSLPLEADLHRTITRGLARVSMPAFPLIPEREKVAVIEYLKTFYPGWEDEKRRRTIVPVPRAPLDLDDERRAGRGRIVYFEMQCSQCHGSDGRGTGATQTEYVDAWGNPQRPFDFTFGSLKGGDTPEDIYRTFHTGLRSIMPSYGGDTLATAAAESFRDKRDLVGPDEFARLEPLLSDFPGSAGDLYDSMTEPERLALAERNSWDLVAYILSLRRSYTTRDAVLGTR